MPVEILSAKENKAINYIKPSKPKERYVVDTINLSDYTANRKRYLITIVYHFSKYRWPRIIKDKKIWNL